MSDGGAAFHWGWLVLFVRALAQNDAAPSCVVIGESALPGIGCTGSLYLCELNLNQSFREVLSVLLPPFDEVIAMAITLVSGNDMNFSTWNVSSNTWEDFL